MENMKKRKRFHFIVPTVYMTSLLVVGALGYNEVSEQQRINEKLQHELRLQKYNNKKYEELNVNLSNRIQQQKVMINRQSNEIKVMKSDLQRLKHNIKKLSSRSNDDKGEVWKITAYTAGYESTGKNPSDEYYGVTASMNKVREGHTIACPPEIPFNTKLYIEGIGVRTCDDRGGAIKGKHIDLYVEQLKVAQDFGVQYRKVIIKK